ncbi:MAG: hypothetical protein L0H73_02880 [Nitrococcus sp.]|nr:hypothetical protein [Nitrococcus sp.]
MASIDENTFRRAYIISAGNERLRIADTDDFWAAPATNITRYYQNGVPTGFASAREFKPQLNAFWSSVVLQSLDNPFHGYTLFVLDPKFAHQLAADYNNWEGLLDFRTTSVLYLETHDDPLSSFDNNSILVQLLKYMNHWTNVRIAQGYGDLIVCKVPYVEAWNQLVVINASEKAGREFLCVSREVCVPETVFHVLELMRACKTMTSESNSLAEHTFLKTPMRKYFELVRRGRGDPVKLYNNEILADIESWYHRQSATYEFVNNLAADSQLQMIERTIEGDMIVDFSPGMDGPMQIYRTRALNTLYGKLQAGRREISRNRKIAEEKRTMIMTLLTESVTIRMHYKITSLSKVAIWIAIISLLVSVVSVIARN